MPSASRATPAAIRLAPFDAAIFDMDGTLLDTEEVLRDIVFDVCTELGFEMTHDVHRSMVGSSHERTNQLLIEAYGVAFPYSLFDEKCRVIMRERSHGGVPVKAGAGATLTVKEERDVTASVSLTNGAEGQIRYFLSLAEASPALKAKLAEALRTKEAWDTSLRELRQAEEKLRLNHPVGCTSWRCGPLSENWPGRGLKR